MYTYTVPPNHTQYASLEQDGEKYMTQKDFVCDYLQLADQSCDQDIIRLLADVAGTANNKLEINSFQNMDDSV